MQRLLHDYYVLFVDQRYESMTTKAGILTQNTSIFKGDDREEEQRDDAHYRHKRLYGTIVSCPMNFTHETVDLLDPGRPGYQVYVGHDYIASLIRQGYKGKAIPKYCCSTFEQFEKVTLQDVAAMCDIQAQDKVYFSYLVTEPENLLGKNKRGEIYKLRVDQIFCAVRKYRSKVDGRYRNDIVMQGGWMLVEPVMETWEEITTPAGVIMKPKPGDKYLEGIVKHVRKRPGVKAGDRILYEPMSNVPMEVEGKLYYCMKEDEIICLL